MKDQIVKGGELMLFYSGKSIAYATSHTLTLTGETVDVSCKDYGEFGATEVNKVTWEIQSENLYSDTAYDTLFDAMMLKKPVDVIWGHATNYKAEGLGDEEPAFTPEQSGSNNHSYYSGKCLITSLTANAANGENATFSVTLTGNGAFTKTEKHAA